MHSTISRFTLRPQREGEIEALRRLERDAHRRFLSLPGFSDIAAAPAIAPERFARGETIVADGPERGETSPLLLGYVILEELDGLGYVSSLMVAHGFSGQGIGLALLSAAETHFLANGLDHSSLATFRSSPWSGPWYRRHGYVSFPAERIGPELQAVLTRHSGFLDMRTREILLKRLA